MHVSRRWTFVIFAVLPLVAPASNGDEKPEPVNKTVELDDGLREFEWLLGEWKGALLFGGRGSYEPATYFRDVQIASTEDGKALKATYRIYDIFPVGPAAIVSDYSVTEVLMRDANAFVVDVLWELKSNAKQLRRPRSAKGRYVLESGTNNTWTGTWRIASGGRSDQCDVTLQKLEDGSIQLILENLQGKSAFGYKPPDRIDITLRRKVSPNPSVAKKRWTRFPID